jgi:hypothetical protein
VHPWEIFEKTFTRLDSEPVPMIEEGLRALADAGGNS